MSSHLLASLEELAAFLLNWLGQHDRDAADPIRFWQVRLETVVDLFKQVDGKIPVEQLAHVYRGMFVGASSLVDLQLPGGDTPAANARFGSLRDAASRAIWSAMSA